MAVETRRIDQLDPYLTVDVNKASQDLYEVSKNTGTAGSPLYEEGGSRKITAEKLRESLNIQDYLIKDFIGKSEGETLEIDKINTLSLSSNATFTLPTANSSNNGSVIGIRHQGGYIATITGYIGADIQLINFNETLLFGSVTTDGIDFFWALISRSLDDKICSKLVELTSNTYTALANDNIEANAQSLGSDINITIPTAGVAGRMIYVYYPTGSPSAFVVNLIGGFSATLAQLDYFLLRDNGSYWEAISTSQNVATTPDLDAVTTEGNTTTNDITVGGLVVNYPSGSGVATEITKGGNGEALTVTKTSGSGNVASFTGGTTVISEVELSNTTISTIPFINNTKKIVTALGTTFGTWLNGLTAKTTVVDADVITTLDSASSFEAKKTTLAQLFSYISTKIGLGSLTNNFIPKSNGAGGLTDSLLQSRTGGLTLQNSTAIDLNTDAKSYFEFYPLLSNSAGTARYPFDIFPSSSTQWLNSVKSVFRITSGGDQVEGRNTIQQAIEIRHRANAFPQGNGSAIYIDAIFENAQINSFNGTQGVVTIDGTRSDNFVSISRGSGSGSPIHFYGRSYRNDTFILQHRKDATTNTGILNHIKNQIFGSNTTLNNDFGLREEVLISNSNASASVSIIEEFISKNVGTGTTIAGKRLKHNNNAGGATSAHIIGLYPTGVIIGDTTALPNSATQLDLQATNKGLGLNIITTRPTGRKFNIFGNNNNDVIEYSDTTGSSFKELAVYKFDELLQVSDCNASFATANAPIYFPFIPKCDMNITKIFYNLQSAGTDTVRVAIYSDSSNAPTTLLVQSNESTTGATVTGNRSITIATTRLIGGTRYWIAIKNDNGATSFLSKNNVFSNNITREGTQSGAFITTPSSLSSLNAVWLGIGI